MEVTTIDPLLQTLGVGGVLAAAAWGIYSKLRAQSAADSASADKSQAESALYDKLTAEIQRADKREAELRGELRSVRTDMDALAERCDGERLEAFKSISTLEGRVDGLTDAVAACQARHEHRDATEAKQAAEDEQARRGELDRRKAGQAPRGRRSPKAPR